MATHFARQIQDLCDYRPTPEPKASSFRRSWEMGISSGMPDQLLHVVSYQRRMWMAESYPCGMYFTCAATVRLRSES